MTLNKYYQIGQVCQFTSLPHSTIRFWEKTFPGLKASRSSGGHRYYTASQVDLFNYLKKLLHEEGNTIEGAKKRLAAEKKIRKSQPENEICATSESQPSSSPELMKHIKTELQQILDILNRQ